MVSTESLTEIDGYYKDYLREVRRFCEREVAPAAAAIDRSGTFFPELLAKAAELGLQGLLFDDDWNIDLSRMVLVHETTELVASYSAAVANAIGVARLHSYLLARYADPSVAARWVKPVVSAQRFGSFAITEESAGTDVRAIRTVARRAGDEYLLNGAKLFITQAPVASFSIVLAKLESDARNADTVALVVEFDRPGVSVGADDPMLSFRGVPMAGLYFDDCRVPAVNALRCDGFRGMMEGLNLARIDAASYSCGFLRACLRLCAKYARERVVFGQRLADLQAIQLKLGRMATDYEAARELTLRAAESFARGSGGDPILLSKAKLFATDAAMHHATEAVQIHGGYGVTMEYDVQRFFRDAKAAQIMDGTSEIHSVMIGRDVIKRDIY